MDNKLKIINYLGKHFQEVFTMHELSKLTQIPYATFYRTITTMKDILELKNIGKSTTLKLKTKDPVIKAYLTISSEEEKKEFLQEQALIKKITQELETKDIVLLFGSYAKRKENGKSDLDLLIINKEGEKTISFSRYEIIFKKKINPIFMTIKEFKNMLNDREENVGKQALKSHIILNNPTDFWRIVFHGV